jgi:hypothetical protein
MKLLKQFAVIIMLVSASQMFTRCEVFEQKELCEANNTGSIKVSNGTSSNLDVYVKEGDGRVTNEVTIYAGETYRFVTIGAGTTTVMAAYSSYSNNKTWFNISTDYLSACSTNEVEIIVSYSKNFEELLINDISTFKN